jgi:hypothetical protein
MFDAESVASTMEKQPGKLPATLHRRTAGSDTFTDYAYAYAYLWPTDSATGLAAGGFPDTSGKITLYQMGETYAPRVDDRITIDGTVWQVIRVTSRQNKQAGYGCHDCDVE